MLLNIFLCLPLLLQSLGLNLLLKCNNFISLHMKAFYSSKWILNLGSLFTVLKVHFIVSPSGFFSEDVHTIRKHFQIN